MQHLFLAIARCQCAMPSTFKPTHRPFVRSYRSRPLRPPASSSSPSCFTGEKCAIYLLVCTIILILFCSQISCPILAAINDKRYDTIKPSRLHITAAIKTDFESTRPFFEYSSRVFDSMRLCVCVCVCSKRALCKMQWRRCLVCAHCGSMSNPATMTRLG